MREPLTKHTGHLVEGLVWTTERPTVPGWYWWRCDDPIMSKVDPCIIELVAFPEEPPKYWLVVGAKMKWSLGNTPGEWSGPIPLPTDAPAQDWYQASEVEAWLEQALLPRRYNNTVYNGVIDDLLDRLRKGKG